jgi:hypothetical protein
MRIRKNGKVINLTEGDIQRIVKRVIKENTLPMSDFDDLSDDEYKEMIKRDVENMNRGDEFTYYDPTNSEHPFGGRYVNDSGWWDTHNRPEYSGEWEDYEFDDFTELKRSKIPNQNYRKLRTRRDFDTLKNPETGKVHIRKRKY